MKGTSLVTGVTGFTGGRLAELLLQRNEKVRGLARTPERADRLRRLGVKVIPGDLRDAAAVARAMPGVDTVYHVAATYRQGGIPRQQYFDINVGGTKNVLDAAVRHGVSRVLHVSTVGVHGHIGNPPANEETAFGPGDPYQESKLEAERLAFRRGADGGLDVTVVRPAAIFGPGDTRFLKLFRPIDRGRFIMIGSGHNLYHLVYVDDLCRGMIRAAESPRAVGRAYILAGPPAIPIRELVGLIARVLSVPIPRWRVPFGPVYLASWICELGWKVLPGDPPLYRRRVDFFRKSRSFDIARAREEIGYEPEVGLEEGLRRTLAWYCSEGLIDPGTGGR